MNLKKEAFHGLLEEMKEGMRVVIDDPEFCKLGGQMAKKQMDAFVAEGFSREEAVLLIAHQGVNIKKT